MAKDMMQPFELYQPDTLEWLHHIFRHDPLLKRINL